MTKSSTHQKNHCKAPHIRSNCKAPYIEDTKWPGTHKEEEARTDKNSTAKENTSSKTHSGWVLNKKKQEQTRTQQQKVQVQEDAKANKELDRKKKMAQYHNYCSGHNKQKSKKERKKEEIRMEVRSSSSTLYLGMRWMRLAPKWLKATVTSMFLSKVS